MCGIGGWFGNVPWGEAHADELALRLRHRGPDARGIRSWPRATLVHARLSIIDLTPTGEQPLDNEDGRIWTVFNGEIYNHHVLRDGLEARGHRFRGRSDSEVLPHLYEERGADFLGDLRGMFAFAIYDASREKLLLARDRFGIKPLFYAPTKDGLAFASELRALQHLPGIDLSVDRQALADYTALTYVPAPATFYKGIRALEPGCFIEADLAGGELRYRAGRYHRWTIAPREELSLDAAVASADGLVERAVRSQLESDVPIGSLLSGGIDSSLVSAAAQKALAPEQLRTFNVRFPDAAYDETWAALAVAEHIGSSHETLPFEAGGGTWDAICSLLTHAGQPFADTSMFAVSSVSRTMRQRVKVALSGDGGDEAFGGYDLYWMIERFERLRAIPQPLLSAGATLLDAASIVNRKYGRWADRLRKLERDDTSIVASLFTWVREEEQAALVRDIRTVDPLSRLYEKKWDHQLPATASAVDRLDAHATEVNTRLVLPNDFLFKVDIASMRESLEVRVPMLDEDLFSLGLSLPHRAKVAGKTAKLVLRALAAKKLPHEVAVKPKWGFGVPLDTWTGDDFRVRLRQELTPASPISEYYDPAAYMPIVDAFCNRAPENAMMSRQGLYQRVIMLLAVHLALTVVRPSVLSPASSGTISTQ